MRASRAKTPPRIGLQYRPPSPSLTPATLLTLAAPKTS